MLYILGSLLLGIWLGCIFYTPLREKLDQKGRDDPIRASICLIIYGSLIYFIAFSFANNFKAEFEEKERIKRQAEIEQYYKTSGDVLNNDTSDKDNKSEEFSFQDQLKNIVVKLIDTPSSIIPIILAPYFWVLWIWRHNDKEADKKNSERAIERSLILDEQDKFNRVFNMAGANSGSLRLVGVEKLCEFLKLFENDKDKYEKYCEDAISLLANSSYINGEGIHVRRIMDYSVFKKLTYLQWKFLEITKRCAKDKTYLWYLREENLHAYDCSNKGDVEDIRLVNVEAKLSILKHIMCELAEDTTGVRRLDLFGEDKNKPIVKFNYYLCFSHSCFDIDCKIQPKMVEYLSDEYYIRESELRFSNYETPIGVIEEINSNNSSLDIDIDKYRENQL